jgi:hypothetical protein
MDLLLVGVGLLCLLYRRRIRDLEARVELCSSQIRDLQAQSATTLPVPVATEAPAGTLMERKDMPERQDRRSERPSIDAYERAEQLLAKGLDTKEVSRQTGLSLAELQLIGKVSSRTQ